MWLKRLLPKVFLIIGFLSIFLLIKYQGSIKDLWLHHAERFKIYYDNFFFQFSQDLERRRPVTLVEREEELKAYIGEPFISFTHSDWNKFWNLIYSGFPKVDPQRPDLPKKMRQLSEDEIADELMSLYPQPFAFFKDSHWRILFSIIFNR